MYHNLIGELVNILTDQSEEHELEDGTSIIGKISFNGILIDTDETSIALGGVKDGKPVIKAIIEKRIVVAMFVDEQEPKDDMILPKDHNIH